MIQCNLTSLLALNETWAIHSNDSQIDANDCTMRCGFQLGWIPHRRHCIYSIRQQERWCGRITQLAYVRFLRPALEYIGVDRNSTGGV